MHPILSNILLCRDIKNIIFAINQRYSYERPLLQLDMEVKHEKLTNVSVVTYTELSELKNANLTNTTVCVDEIYMEKVKPEDLHEEFQKST